MMTTKMVAGLHVTATYGSCVTANLLCVQWVESHFTSTE